MASTVFEIVELDNGEFVLRRSGKSDAKNTEKNNEPLVSIKFSGEALKFLDGNSSDIAKVMIEAGLLEVEDLINQYILEEDVSLESEPRVLH